MDLIGTIQLNNTIIISDPCYGIGTWCQHILHGIKPGTYKCYVHYFYDKNWEPTYRRVGYIIICHEDYNIKPTTTVNCCIDIDAGCCGIYDLDYFKKYHRNYNEKETVDDNWYDSIINNIHLKQPNQNYVEFEKSKYYSNEYNWTTVWGIENKEEQEAAIRKTLKAERDYNADTNISSKDIDAQAAYCRDNKCIISASAYGDCSANVLIGKNKDEIVSIKLSFK